MIVGLFSFTSCYEDSFNNKIDEENTLNEEQYDASQDSDEIPPTPGNSGIITAGTITKTTMKLYWTRALDNVSDQDTLQYMVYYSEDSAIYTYNEAEAKGTRVTPGWTVDIDSLTVYGLEKKTAYYFSVFVRDETYFISVYNLFNEMTGNGDDDDDDD
jgi:hypothetical protein